MPFTGCGKIMNSLWIPKTTDKTTFEINNSVPIKEQWHWTEYFVGVGAALVVAFGAYYFWIKPEFNLYVNDVKLAEKI